MSAGTVKLPHVNTTGIEHWLQHTAGPGLVKAGEWLMTAVKDFITALVHHQIPNPAQSLASICLIVAIIGMVINRAKARKAKESS